MFSQEMDCLCVGKMCMSAQYEAKDRMHLDQLYACLFWSSLGCVNSGLPLVF